MTAVLPGLPGADGEGPAPLLQRFGRAFSLEAHVTAVAFVGDRLGLALGDGTVRFVPLHGGEAETVSAHADGTILSAAADPARGAILTGGDDGRLSRVFPDGRVETVATSRRWIDTVAAHPSGALAFAAGRTVTLIAPDGARREIEVPSAGAALAFAPDGRTLAVAHRNGASLLEGPAGKVRRLDIPGPVVFVSAAFSPDGRFLAAGMPEMGVVAWRLSDGQRFGLGGLPGKPGSLAFTGNGLFLAVSGAKAVVLWPFRGKRGPAGRDAEVIARHEAPVTFVAPHPRDDVVAAGFRDGAVVLARRTTDEALAVRPGTRPSAAAAVTALAFSADGAHLAFGTAGGAAGLLDARRALARGDLTASGSAATGRSPAPR